jgi:hypothetical protein
VGWKIDGRKGRAIFGGSRREGFALMRDPDKRLIAFQPSDDDNFHRDPSQPSTTDQLLIREEAFEPIDD